MSGGTGRVVPVVVVHGGAWAIPDRHVVASRRGVEEAARAGDWVLAAGQSALEAVETAVRLLEDNPVFDAGTGSVLTSSGEVEMDAIIMDGRNLDVGAVACVKNIANPVSLARVVLDKSDHTLLVGPGANQFAAEQEIPTKSTSELVTQEARRELQEYLQFNTAVNVSFRPQESHDTVGAVAVDRKGNVAFATSTGGITAKRPGRVGDSPLVGCGGYCDNEVGAVSTTGHGESITKVCLAHHIIGLAKQDLTPQLAVEQGLAYMKRRVGGCGGVIMISNTGQVGVHFTTERMAWALAKGGRIHSGVEPQDLQQQLEQEQLEHGERPEDLQL